MLQDGDIRIYTGCQFRITIQRDEDARPPWQDQDGHGIVTDWLPQNAREPGWRTLPSSGNAYRFYDFNGSYAMALRDGWDAPPYGGTPDDKATRATEADFEYLRRWCNDEWWYGISATLLDADGQETAYHASLWGIESDDTAYHPEVAQELMEEAYHLAARHDALPMTPQRRAQLSQAAVTEQVQQLPYTASDAWL